MKKVIIGKDKKTNKDKLQIFTPIDERKKEEERILKKYPKLFRQKDLSISETAMCWGLNIGEGWFWLLERLCEQLQWDIDRNKHPQIEFTQIKEKFGLLRAHTNGSDDKQYGMIDLAEYLSGFICEECGTTKDVSQNKKGYIRTLCIKCRKNEK